MGGGRGTNTSIVQYITYKKGFQGHYERTAARSQKNLLSLSFFLDDSEVIFCRMVECVKDIKKTGQMCFNTSRLYYEESNDTIEVNENIGFDDNERYSTFLTSQEALLSIVQRWKDMRPKRKNFVLMTLNEDNYVDFFTFDTQQELDMFLKMHYRGDGNDASA